MSASDIAISVRGVGKAYTIRHTAAHAPTTLGEAIISRITRPLGRRTQKETFWALKDVSFDVKKGEVVGIIGRNGAGKSTLLKILSRITEMTEGEVDLFGRVGSLLEVGTGFHQELSGRENIFLNGAILGMTRSEIKKQFEAIVEFAGVEKFLDTPVKRYSSGMYVRLAFAVAAHLRSEILIVDEVLAVGDGEFQKKCLGKMKEVSTDGRTVLFVSHNMAAIAGLCGHALVLSSGQLVASNDVGPSIDQYMRASNAERYNPPAGPLREISARQIGRAICIHARFEHAEPLKLPSLGFVVYDSTGNPLFGSNPRLSGVEPLASPLQAGIVDVQITEPALRDGQYHMSAWFGDGHQDFVAYPNCITFQVLAMGGVKQLPASVVGSVIPRCVWEFQASDLATLSLAQMACTSAIIG